MADIALKDPEELRRKEVEIEEGLTTLSKYLDGLFRVPGTGWRFGLDSLIGLIPNFGDLATLFPSFYILFAGVRYGVPKITILRMGFNIALDYVVGMIPFLGDAFDFVWKSNQRNMDLIRSRATAAGKAGTKADYFFVIGIMTFLLILLAASIAISAFIIWQVLSGIWTEISTGNI